MAGTVRNVYIIQTKSAYITMTQKHRATIATTTQGRRSRKENSLWNIKRSISGTPGRQRGIYAGRLYESSAK